MKKVVKAAKAAKAQVPRVTVKSHAPKAVVEEKVVHLTHQQHAYNISDMYIGCDEQVEREEFILDLETDKVVKATISLPEGVERLFLEIISNASDNVGRSRRLGIDPGVITVTMDYHTITVTNQGKVIPIVLHEEGMYVPELLFGTMLTSTNYEGDRHEAGRNGLGAKLCNIFSKLFTVEVGDQNNGLHYSQVWRDNMLTREPPVIEKYNGTNFVKFSYTLDFERFGYTQYPDEAFFLFARHCADISFTAKVVTTFNETSFDLGFIKDYAKLYFGDSVKNSITHYEFEAGVETVTQKSGQIIAKDGYTLPRLELIVIDTPDEGESVSFVNCMMTRQGGTHVQAAVKAVSTLVVGIVNKDNKPKKTDVKRPRITIADVKPHISMVLSVRVVNPKFAGQTKSALTAPTPKVTISEEELKPMLRWRLLDRLFASLEAKQYNVLSKTDGKKRRHVALLRGVDANEAGRDLSEQCGLFAVEGNSAMGYVNTMITNIPKGRDFIGTCPMKGKPLNVLNANALKIAENKEWCELKTMLGLREGVDYSSEEEFSTLRYGYLVILADADDDGKHIAGIILLYFFCRFPSLLQRGFVYILNTPVLRATKGKQKLSFFSEAQYLLWKEETPNNNTWKVRFHKGLGASNKDDIKEDTIAPRYVSCVFDDTASESLHLAFDKDLADRRKVWIARWTMSFDIEEIKEQPISNFINKELIQYSVANLHRSIPSVMDGLKPSQRKIIWASLNDWTWTRGKTYEELKIEDLVALVSKETKYHHGNASLVGTVVGMAHDFVGSNNLPYFTREGSMGTRIEGGKDAAQPRYVGTCPEKWVPYVFRKEDIPLLDIIEEEGKKIEPKFLLPILPMHLINGANGIGSGWSSFIPCHSPVEVVEWLLNKLSGEEVSTEVDPWYQGFTGTIQVITRKKGEEKPRTLNDEAAEELEEDEMPDDYHSRKAMVTSGHFREEKGKIIVDELPIGRWTLKYRKWIEKLVLNKIISDFREDAGSSTDCVHFEIFTKKSIDEGSLWLTKSYGLSNMVLLGPTLVPQKFSSSVHLLETFFEERLPYYQKRKDYILDNLLKAMVILQQKAKFIQLVNAGTIEIRNVPKDKLVWYMNEHELPVALSKQVRANDFSKEKVEILMQELEKRQKEYESVNSTLPEQMWIDDLLEFKGVYDKYYSK